MQRIRSAIVMTIIICLAVGSFYIYEKAAAGGLPQYYLKKEFGDAQEVSHLALSGSFVAGSVADAVSITVKGTTYDSSLSFWQRLNKQFSVQDGLTAYREKYYNFMRGKKTPASFHEDSEKVYYAGLNYKVTNHGGRDFSFAISTLTKKDKWESSFSLPVPSNTRYGMMHVMDVQKAGEDLDVMTINLTGNSSNEIHCYEFDLATKRLVRDRTVMSSPSLVKNTSILFNGFTPTDITRDRNYFVFSKEFDTEGASGSVKKEFYAYNYSTHQLQKIVFPKEINENTLLASNYYLYNGPELFFSTLEDKGIKFIRYNLDQKRVDPPFMISMPEKGKVNDTSLVMKNNRVYVLLVNHGQTLGASLSPTYLTVADIDSGKVLYKGNVAVKNAGKKNDSVQILSINLEE